MLKTRLLTTALALTFGLSAGVSKAEDITLGVVLNNVLYPYDSMVQKGFEDAAAAAGVKAIAISSEGSPEKQSNALDDLKAQGVSGIAFIPNDSLAAAAMVDRMNDANIKMVAVATHIGDQSVKISEPYKGLSALVISDRELAATQAAEAGKPYYPADRPAKIGIAEGAPGFTLVQNYDRDYRAALDKLGVKYEIVGAQPTNWTPEDGQSVCANFLVANPELDVVFAHSDDIAVGCSRAVAAANRKVAIIAVGGGSTFGIRAIKDGDIAATVCVNPYKEGQMAVQALLEAINKPETPMARFLTYDTPTITKDNTDACPDLW